MAQENISAQLNDLLASRDFQAELLDKEGRPTDAENADIFTFDFVSSSGKNYGTMVIILDTDNELQVFYGDNLGRSMEGDDKTEFFDFVQHLHKFANMRRWTYSPKNINQVKYTMQGLAAIREGLFEGYYGTRRVSYSGEPTDARLVIQHNRALSETDARFRYVESLFIETADAERFRLQFKNLAGGRAMLEHVRQGGRPYDIRGSHITEMVSEIATLGRFNRASAGRVLEGVTAELVTEAQQYYQSMRENLKRLAGTRGYQTYFESWHPAETTLQEELVENIKTMFVQQTLDSRIEAALPVLARLQQENRMKEADIFESWADNLTEGTWQLPETPEQQQKLQELMSGELIVGPDATNATSQLNDLVGDDVLFDRLSELAARDASANVWDDSEVQARLAELGIQLPAAAEPAADNNDDGDDNNNDPAAQQPMNEGRVKELEMDIVDPLMSDSEFETKYEDSRANMARELGMTQDRKTGRFYNPDQEFDRLRNSPEFGAQMRRMSEGDVFRRNGKNRNPTIDELEMWIKNWTSFQIGGNLTDAGRAKVGQSIAKAQRLLAKKKQQQGVAEGSLREFAMGGDDGEDPTDNYPCYDCGSTIFLHHTKLCELAEDNATRDLPAELGSQHWTGRIPKGLRPIPGLEQGVAEGHGRYNISIPRRLLAKIQQAFPEDAVDDIGEWYASAEEYDQPLTVEEYAEYREQDLSEGAGTHQDLARMEARLKAARSGQVKMSFDAMRRLSSQIIKLKFDLGLLEGSTDNDEELYHTRILDPQTLEVIADDGPYDWENDAVDRAEAYLAQAKRQGQSIVAQVYQPAYGKNYVTWQVPDQGDYNLKEQDLAQVSLNELAELTRNYYTLSNGKTVQVLYRPNINQSPIPLTGVKVSYVNPALQPQGGSFDSTGQAQRWDSAPDGVKQAIEKFVKQPGTVAQASVSEDLMSESQHHADLARLKSLALGWSHK